MNRANFIPLMRHNGIGGLLLAIGMACTGLNAYAETPHNNVGTGKAKIYKYMNGATASFSDMAPRTGAYIVLRPACYACNLSSTIDWHATQLHTNDFASEITESAQQFGLDPALVRAVIHAESGFNPRARSPKGAIGLMQLMPATARLMGVSDATAPSRNIRGGTRYLASLLQRFQNDVGLAAAAYNAGPEAVKKYAGVPPYAETQVYVQRVHILHQRYRGAFKG